MNRLLNLTDEARQHNSYNYDDKVIDIKLYYSEVNIGWYITIREGDFLLENSRLGCNINFLNNFRRKLKWGLKIESIDGIDPYSRTDFSTDRIKLYFLNEEEVKAITNIDLRYNSELLIHA